MNTPIKVALLTSLTTAALVYVILEWRPLRTEGSRGPEVSWAAPSTLPVEAVTAPAEPAPAADSLSDDEQNNIEIYRKYSASVVNITSSATALNFYLQPVPVEAGTGSGVILDTTGNIVTNYHVIEPSLKPGGALDVTLADNTKYPARIVGKDVSNDLAVIRIDAPKERLSPIPLRKIGRAAGWTKGPGHREPLRLRANPDNRHHQRDRDAQFRRRTNESSKTSSRPTPRSILEIPAGRSSIDPEK